MMRRFLLSQASPEFCVPVGECPQTWVGCLQLLPQQNITENTIWCNSRDSRGDGNASALTSAAASAYSFTALVHGALRYRDMNAPNRVIRLFSGMSSTYFPVSTLKTGRTIRNSEGSETKRGRGADEGRCREPVQFSSISKGTGRV